MIHRIKLIVSEAVRSLFANISTTAAATMTVLIGMFLLGFLIGLSTWGFSHSNHY
jgi:cell division protein FtsX